MTTTARPRLAVVGTGWWATQFHIPGLRRYAGAELVALVDGDEQRLDAASRAFDVRTTYRSLDDLLAARQVDGVLIATPSASHYELARQALEAGLHVMVEKPMTIRASEARDLVRRAASAGLHLQVGYTHQFTDSAARLRGVFQAGDLGECVQISAVFASAVDAYYRGTPDDYRQAFQFSLTGPKPSTYSEPGLAGGGQAHTVCTHVAGMLLWATDLRATEVSAFMATLGLRVDVVDAIAFCLSNGAVGTIGSSGNLGPRDLTQQAIHYYATEGYAIQDLTHATLDLYYRNGYHERVTPQGGDKPYPEHAPGQAFADLIAGRGPNRAPGEYGARAVELLEAAYRAAEDQANIRIQAET